MNHLAVTANLNVILKKRKQDVFVKGRKGINYACTWHQGLLLDSCNQLWCKHFKNDVKRLQRVPSEKSFRNSPEVLDRVIDRSSKFLIKGMINSDLIFCKDLHEKKAADNRQLFNKIKLTSQKVKLGKLRLQTIHAFQVQ